MDYSPSHKLGEFECKDSDYAVWLINDAHYYIEQSISQVKLLLNRGNEDIIGYNQSGKMPRSIPALKIGKLAINVKYERQSYGSYLLWLSLGIAQQMNIIGTACRYLSLDADVSVSPTTDKFYAGHGFKYNKNVNKKRQDEIDKKGAGLKMENISMRYDIFNL